MRIKKSIWKFPYNFNNLYFFKKDVKTYGRNVTLTSRLLDNNLKCYKGKIIGKLQITKSHLGHKLGEFFPTKILGDRIAYRKKQKKLLKKNKMRNVKKK
jgi:ribosomal protein S19